MLEDTYKREMDDLYPDGKQMERLLAVMGEKRCVGFSKPLRTALVAAAVCVVLVTTAAAAYLMGAFDFLKAREEYQFLGQTERYERYSKIVNLSQTAANGDVLTIESMALDGNFCTLIYKLESKEPMAAWSDINQSISEDAPDIWQAMILNPSFHIAVDGDLPGWNGGQQFLADARTLYGMTRIALERPMDKGEHFTIHVGPSLSELQTDPDLKEIESLDDVPDKWAFDLVADPLETEMFQMEEGTLTRSPMGTVLKTREGMLGGDVVLRDADTGAYIPYGYAFNMVGPEYILYELYGDTSELKNLEIIPIEWGESYPKIVTLDELPTRGNNAVGDYEVSAVEIGAEQIVVRQRPVGATPRGASMVEFVDADGNILFREDSFDCYVSTFTDWTDGSVVITYSLGDTPEGYIERIAGVRYTAHSYTLQEEQAINITLK